MKLTEQQVAELTELAKTNKDVKALLDFYDNVVKSRIYDSFLIRQRYSDNWNKELDDKEINIINTGKDAEVHDKAVERAVKWFDGQLKFLKDTEAMYSMLTPEEKSKLSNDIKVKRQIVDIAL